MDDGDDTDDDDDDYWMNLVRLYNGKKYILGDIIYIYYYSIYMYILWRIARKYYGFV